MNDIGHGIGCMINGLIALAACGFAVAALLGALILAGVL